MSDSSFSNSHNWHRHHRTGMFVRLRRAFLATFLGAVAWVCFTLLYVGFWAHGFSLFQSIIVVIVSLLVLAGLVVGSWISFGLRFAGGWDD
jgi:uncharacterized membrane protein